MAITTLEQFIDGLRAARDNKSMLSVGLGPNLVISLLDKLDIPDDIEPMTDMDNLQDTLAIAAASETSIVLTLSHQLSQAVVETKLKLDDANNRHQQDLERISDLEATLQETRNQHDELKTRLERLDR